MSSVKPGSKYYPLYEFLRAQGPDHVTLSIDAIDRMVDGRLPASARKGHAFWSNRARGALQASAWMDAGFHVQRVSLASGQVTFARRKANYHVERQAGAIMWNAEMVRALRQHMDVNQAELAQILGVRQQTISEWETGVYRPTRGRSKHLTMIAERAEFPFDADKSDQPSS